MAFCTKCGQKLSNKWKHCSLCGTEINKNEKPIAQSKTIPKPKTEPLKKIINEKELSFFDPKNTQRNYQKEGFIVFAVLILIFGLVTFSLNNSSNEKADLELTNQNEANQIALDKAKQLEDEIANDKANFYASLEAFKAAGCKPKIYKNDKSRTDNWAMELENITGIEDFPWKYAFNSDKKDILESWGNPVDRTLVVIASYELKMSSLYWYIFDLYKNDGMGKYKNSFNQYFNSLNKMATSLCYQTEPTAKQLALAQELMPKIDSFRGDFIIWVDDAKNLQQEISDNISAEVKDYNTPKCIEIPTDNPNYNIVKCTNIR